MSQKNSLLKNFSWKFAERATAQGVALVVSLILARLLAPADYGVISIVAVLITLANALVTDGFGSALIQKKNADALDFFSVLYFTIGFSVVLYAILFFVAPFISNFYGEGYEVLTMVIRALGLLIILSGINSVQQAYVARKMIFKTSFWATLTGSIISAIVGITLAFSGFGVWALVAQHLTNTLAGTISLTLLLKKKPQYIFSFQRLRRLLKYGSKLISTRLLITGYEELRTIIIGKLYSFADLAYFDRGKQFPNLIATNINTTFSSVLFPKMAKEQENIEKVREITLRAIRFSAYVMSPLMIGLAVIAEPLIRLVLTEKWLGCVPLLQLFCVVNLFQPIHSANLQAIKAIGQSDVFFKLEVIKKTIELVVLFCVMWYGVKAIVISIAVLTALFTLVNAYPNKMLLNYTLQEQMKDIAPSLLMSAVMAAFVWPMTALPIGDFVMLLLQIIAGMLIYITLSILTKNKEFFYILGLFNPILRKFRRSAKD